MTAIGFILGCWLLLQWSYLPSLWALFFVASVFFCGGFFLKCRWCPLLWVVGCFAMGLFWQGWHCQELLKHRLTAPQEGKTLIVVGAIVDIPRCDERHCTFTFFHEAPLLAGKSNIELSPKMAMKLSLSWYGIKRSLHVGQRWKLAVKLKRPRGTLNPGAFDAEAWTWQQHIAARGNVNVRGSNQFLGLARGYQFARWREKLLQTSRVILKGEPLGGVVTALSLGWIQDITPAQRLVVQRTGTAHLLAISGLHVGMVAGLFLWCISWLWSKIPHVTGYVPAPTVGAVVAIVIAVIYSEMAGFACSTQRACIMCALLLLPKLVHRHMTVKTALFLAVWVVLLWDPCVVQSSGFWLSFSAVFVLVYAQYAKDAGRWAQHFQAQWVCLIGLLPLSCLYFHQISLVCVLANLIAIPLVGFVVLPLVLLGTALAVYHVAWSQFVFGCALKVLGSLGLILSKLSALSWAAWSVSFSQGWEFLVVTAGCALVLFTKSNWRWAGLMSFLTFLLPPPFPLQKGQFKLSLLDVGQGLASVVSTRHHALIYDTGPRFSKERDCGQTIVIPYLQQEKIRTVDMLVVSHGDNDHAGGALSILKGISINELYTSVPKQFEPEKNAAFPHTFIKRCQAGAHWEWDGVTFEFLHPPVLSSFKSNDRSCVLKVTSPHGSVLLAGDIEKEAEYWLCDHLFSSLLSTILIVPHHGSKTSSTSDFLESVHPQVALFSFGYRNSYHHPHSQVMQRYQVAGIETFNTVGSGTICYNQGKSSPWSFYRDNHREFWRVRQ